jgi:hypothetical protein
MYTDHKLRFAASTRTAMLMRFVRFRAGIEAVDSESGKNKSTALRIRADLQDD